MRFAKLGYRVVYGSRNPESEDVKALVESTGHLASAVPSMEASQQAHIVVIAIAWPQMETVAQSLGSLDGKIVIDISAPVRQGDDGYPEVMMDKSGAEAIQEWNPGARVVKAFGTVGS